MVEKMLSLSIITISLGAASMPDPEAADVAWVARGGFCEPETVLPLPDETLLVSNVCDFRQTGNGYLSLLDQDGSAIDWRILEGLDAPLGMAMAEDRLYVVDNNQVKIFHWPDFEPMQTIALNASVANDIAVAPDHTIYVTDTARHLVIVIGAEQEQAILTGEARFKGANGIHYSGGGLWVGGEKLWHVELQDLSITTIGPAWLSDIDGIELEADGTVQVTPVGGPLIRLASEVMILGGDGISSANHGYSSSLGLALIPTGFDNTVVAIRVD